MSNVFLKNKQYYSNHIHGFTLLELLIAFTIMSVIVIIVYLGLDSISKGTDLARLSAEKMRIQRFLVNHFINTFNALYIDPSFSTTGYEFFGKNESGPYGPADSIRFCTSLPMPGPVALPGIRRVVTYSFEDEGAPEGVSGFATDMYGISNNAPQYLVITESPLVLDEESGISDDMNNLPMNIIRVPLATLDIWYYDPATQDWVEEWDSQSIQQMPWAVHIIANLFNEYGEVNNMGDAQSGDIDLVIVLPTTVGTVQPMDDPNHFRDTGSLFKMDGNKTEGKTGSSGKNPIRGRK
ncbi:MAG TPA: prepilin-type N-terminal cleavage/methylation domain-containing protein [Candidatus Hydrogenedens sp.]|nr:prepilin-type N-terminal cleavage/methylation domain-containing protein [Candidatus Hydrogenedens sp.]HOK08420.1 prepilin-type N-terminal cleavage/methylation domain-containing protein [Candidatus Hydrogenedens sp.]HOL19451.1 prepilin-type N-terminal cleavage/methylation domain-containing protein [Candidatus Hydrogenedens sp.]HPP58167.1 prepilin-type N-terminal cleavage/methylation domain-containing protein [Candidatus Hydrogenedens sp.]